MKKALFVSILSGICFANVEGGEYSRNDDTLTFSSGYFESQYTNDQLATFGLEINRGWHRLDSFILEKVNPQSNAATWGTKILTRGLGLMVSCQFLSAYHEIGHGLRGKAYDIHYQLTEHNDHSGFKKDENFFKYFISHSPFSRAACKYNLEDGVRVGKNMTKEEAAKANVKLTAGGVNNEIYFSEKIADGLHERGAIHFEESASYLMARIGQISYPKHADEWGDDPYALEQYYKDLNINVTKNDMSNAGLISLALSGTTYSILYNGYKSFADGVNYAATPFEFHGFRIPDTFSYWTSKGISYKLVSGYKIDEDNAIIFGGEHVFKGQSATEYSLGFKKYFKSFNDTSVKVVMTFGEGFNIESAVSVPVMKNLSINFGANSYACKSLLGERHARDMKDGKKRSNAIFASISYRY